MSPQVTPAHRAAAWRAGFMISRAPRAPLEDTPASRWIATGSAGMPPWGVRRNRAWFVPEAELAARVAAVAPANASEAELDALAVELAREART